MNPESAPTHPARPTLWDRLLRIERRLIYLFLGIAVAVPLFVPFRLRPRAMDPVISLFNTIDSLPQDKAVVISVDYAPDTEAELQPMTVALLRHAFARRLKGGVLSMAVQGLGLADAALNSVVAEFNARTKAPAESLRYGRDYVFWGFQTPALLVMTGMGEDISKVFPADAYRNRTDTLPISEAVRNYSNTGIVVSIAASSFPLTWVTYAQTVFGVRIGTGITAVSAADFYPYYSKTRQFSGLLSGMKGAAEYEELLAQHYPETAGGRRRATESMSSQTTAHFAIMLLIVVGNVAFFAVRRRKS
ncbi:MAG: hypothetical protein ABIK62_01525 [candidate division WOR-3 bacterium]